MQSYTPLEGCMIAREKNVAQRALRGNIRTVLPMQ